MDQVKLAYLAGFFDGEGSIHTNLIRRKAPRWGVHYQPCVNFCNNDPKIGDLIKELPGKWRVQEKARPPNRRISYLWTVSSVPDVLSVLKELRPFLVVKKELANLMIRYCELRLGKMRLPPQERVYTEEEENLALRIRGYNKMKAA